MPGREDFGIIRARLMGDPRAHDAGDRLVEAGLAEEDTAVVTVAGLVGLLGLYAAINTDDGVLSGDGISAARAALSTSKSVARGVVDALTSSGLLRAADGGVYLAGFSDAYGPLIERRERDRKRKASVRGTSAGRPKDVRAHRTVPDRTEPKEAPGEASAGHPEDVRGTRSHLSSSVRQELGMHGVRVGDLNGSPVTWEKQIAAALKDGWSVTGVAAAIKGAPALASPFEVLKSRKSTSTPPVPGKYDDVGSEVETGGES